MVETQIRLLLHTDQGLHCLHCNYFSRVMRKPVFGYANKDKDQLRNNRAADQDLCFRYIASTIPFLHKSEISSLYPSSVAAQPALCRTWLETQKTGFLATSLISPCFVGFMLL